MKKKKAPQDSTIRNIKAAHRREAQILSRLARLELRMDRLASAMWLYARAQR